MHHFTMSHLTQLVHHQTLVLLTAAAAVDDVVTLICCEAHYLVPLQTTSYSLLGCFQTLGADNQRKQREDHQQQKPGHNLRHVYPVAVSNTKLLILHQT